MVLRTVFHPPLLVRASLSCALVLQGCQAPGPAYLGTNVGLSLAPGVRHLSTVESDTDPGPSLALAVGVSVGQQARLELELSHRSHGFGDFFVDGARFDGSGHVSATTLMLNSIIDIPLSGEWTGYAGGGIGWARVGYDVDAFGQAPFVDDRDNLLATQVLLGVTRPLSEAWTLILGYRLQTSEDPRFRDAMGARLDAEYLAHTFEIGLRFGL